MGVSIAAGPAAPDESWITARLLIAVVSVAPAVAASGSTTGEGSTEKSIQDQHDSADELPPVLEGASGWEDLLSGAGRKKLEERLLAWVPTRRWSVKALNVRDCRIFDTIDVMVSSTSARLILFQVEYENNHTVLYCLPLVILQEPEVIRLLRLKRTAFVAWVGQKSGAALYDASYYSAFCLALLQEDKRTDLHGAVGQLEVSEVSRVFVGRHPDRVTSLEPLKVTEGSFTNIVYGNRFILKLYRQLQEGVLPEFEIGQLLTKIEVSSPIPPLAGWVEYTAPERLPAMVGLLHGYVPNEGDAWGLFQKEARAFLERVHQGGSRSATAPPYKAIELGAASPPEREYAKQLHSSLGYARSLGAATAQFHRILAEQTAPDFFAEPLSLNSLRELYDDLSRRMEEVGALVHAHLELFPSQLQADAQTIFNRSEAIVQHYGKLLNRNLRSIRCRIHGNYHLGNVLCTDSGEFVITGFAGDPEVPLSERRRKNSPLHDVAKMIRSFSYAAYVEAFADENSSVKQKELAPWVQYWFAKVQGAFFDEYFEVFASFASHLSTTPALLRFARRDTVILLECYYLLHALRELQYELSNRPSWCAVPLRAILDLVRQLPDFAQPRSRNLGRKPPVI